MLKKDNGQYNDVKEWEEEESEYSDKDIMSSSGDEHKDYEGFAVLQHDTVC